MQGEDRVGPSLVAAEVSQPQKSTRQPLHHSILLIVLIAFLLRLAVITVGHTYRITPRRDHFQFDGLRVPSPKGRDSARRQISLRDRAPGLRLFIRTFSRVYSNCSECTVRFLHG
jgi:hypothetical protein